MIKDSGALIQKIVIVGGGTAGWMAAATFARTMGKQVSIQLIESDEIGTVGVGEATIPQIKLFNSLLGVDENDFLKATQGTIKLGIQFNNWGRQGDSYMHAFSGIGIDLGMIDFYQYWLRSIHDGVTSSLWDYSLNTQAAYKNLFAKMERVGETRLPGINYAYHFDASLWAKYLRTYCEHYSVVRIQGKIATTILDPDNGFIESVVLENGDTINGDLFIDCSGFRSLLIEGALKTGYEDWSHWLPCDSAIAVPCASSEILLPYTRATAHSAGWQWRIPLQHRIGNGHVFCSKFMSDDKATQILLDNLDGEALAEPRKLQFVTGKRKKIWNKNCIALGLASGFMEPLESTSIHLIQHALGKLVELFPRKDFAQADADEFNRQLSAEYEHIRDFIILHYHATERTDSEFWNYCRTMEVPASLKRKMNLFRESARLFRDDNELFSEVGWLQVMIGQRIIPKSYHPLADALTAEELKEYLANIKTIVEKAVAVLPTHEAYISKFCAAVKI
ncbi:MAG: tryptophan 7-halogenase [Gammaproteobacteria bacterium]|nr:MAG: tryptophan 7-halogenase [Gammaproteobacteria bacterium]